MSVDSAEENNDTEDTEYKKYIGELPETVVQKMFSTGAKIKSWIFGIVIAIPFFIIAYLVAGWFAIIAIPFAIIILWWAAAHWVKVQGIRLIYDGDIDPEDPSAGVEHIDYIIPIEQWKMLAVSDIGGAYPVKSLDGPAYRVEHIEFYDENETIAKTIVFAWGHANDSNFGTKHALFHQIAEWLKESLKLNTTYEELNEILAIQQAKDIHKSFEDAKNVAMSRPMEANERIDKIMGKVKVIKREMNRIEKMTKQTQDKPWAEKEGNNENNGNEGSGETGGS